MSDDLEDLLRAARPEPSARLRARVLAAMATVERIPPWWARVRTWAAAALVLISIDGFIITQSRSSASDAGAETVLIVDDALLPCPALARAIVRRSESWNAPTLRSTLKDQSQ
jgi:hypothetical protein